MVEKSISFFFSFLDFEGILKVKNPKLYSSWPSTEAFEGRRKKIVSENAKIKALAINSNILL